MSENDIVTKSESAEHAGQRMAVVMIRQKRRIWGVAVFIVSSLSPAKHAERSADGVKDCVEEVQDESDYCQDHENGHDLNHH